MRSRDGPARRVTGTIDATCVDLAASWPTPSRCGHRADRAASASSPSVTRTPTPTRSAPRSASPDRRALGGARRRPCAPTRAAALRLPASASTASGPDPEAGRRLRPAGRVGLRRRSSGPAASSSGTGPVLRGLPRVDDRPPCLERCGRRPADWIDPAAAATCEMVALLAARLGVPLDADDGALATTLMAGIVMDTATFAPSQHDPADAARRRGAPRGRRAAGRDLAPPLPHQADDQLRLFGRVLDRLESTVEGLVLWSTLLDEDLARRPARSVGVRGHHRPAGAGRRPPRSRSCSRRPVTATRISVRTQARRRRRDGAHRPVRRRRPCACRRRDDRAAARRRATRSSLPRRSASPRRRPLSSRIRAARASARQPGPTRRHPRRREAGRPDLARHRRARPPADRRRGASATAGRSTRSRPACCRSSSGSATRVVEYHLGDDQALPRDGLLRRVAPRPTTSMAS